MSTRSFITHCTCAVLLCLAYGQSRAQLQAGEEDRFNLARNLFRDARDYATAGELFAEFIRNHPHSRFLPEARLFLARSYGRTNRYAEAVAAYESFYQNHPEHLEIAAARRERASCLAAMGHYLKAGQAYEDVQRRFSASDFAPAVLLEAARYYTRADSLSQATRVYDIVIDQYGRTSAAHTARYRLARLRFASGHAEAAQQLLSQIAVATPPAEEAPSALLLSGRIHLFLGDQNGATARFERLQQRYPQSAQADTARLEQADFLLAQRQFTQASDAYLVAMENTREPAIRARARLGAADSKRLSHQHEGAERHYRILQEERPPAHPFLPKVQLGLAITLGQTGRFADAVGLLQELMQTAPQSQEARSALRELGELYRQRGDHVLAISWYRRYLEEAVDAPDHEQVKLILASTYSATGDYASAATTYRSLADTEGPWAGEAQFGLARAYEAAGHFRAALREYLVVLEQYPSSRHAQNVRNRVEYLRDFSVYDPQQLNQALQQAWLDQLAGASRQAVQWNTARTLIEHQDYGNAVRLLEHFIAVNPSNPDGPEAQSLLAESLLRLARKKELESQPDLADSLRQLAMQELRILASDDDGGLHTQQAQLQLLQLEAGTAPDSLALVRQVSGLREYLDQHGSSRLADTALLHLGDALRQLALLDDMYAPAAMGVYERLANEYPNSHSVAAALYGLGVTQARRGHIEAAESVFNRLLQNHSGSSVSPLALFELGQMYHLQSRYTEAKARLEELRWAYPASENRHAAHELLAAIYVRLGEYENAVALYEQLIDGLPDTERAIQLKHRLAQAYLYSGQLQTALSSYNMLANYLDPYAKHTHAILADSVHLAKGEILEKLDRVQEAIGQYLRVQIDPESSLSTEAIGRASVLMFHQEQYAEAYKLIEPHLKMVEDPEVYGHAVVALFRQGQLDAARDGTRTFTRRFGDQHEWIQRFRLEEGQQLIKNRRFSRARDLFQQVTRAGDEWADVGAYYASLAFWEENAANPSREATARALEAQTQFLRSYPDSPHAPSVHMRLGDYQYSLRNYLQAAGAYRQVFNRAQDRALAGEALWRLVSSYQAAHEYDEAYQAVQRLITDFADHPRRRDGELEIGIILKDMGRFSQAIEKLEYALQFAQGDRASEARYYIGESYQNMGEYRRAIEAYYRVSFHGAEGHSQWITSADYRRAQCHEALGEYNTAIAVYNRIVQREGGDSPQGRLANERIVALRNQ